MKITQINEYLNNDWKKRAKSPFNQPLTCKRVYVDLDEDKPLLNLTSKGSKTWRVGPFEGIKEASEWTMEHKELW
jgi:hypothetical protein